jgi:hypothetical protein
VQQHGISTFGTKFFEFIETDRSLKRQARRTRRPESFGKPIFSETLTDLCVSVVTFSEKYAFQRAANAKETFVG